MPAPLALIEDAPDADARVVAVRGEIDVDTTVALHGWVDRASDGGRRSVAVDLANVEFMAVSGVYVLCDEAARLAQNEVQLTIVCAQERILRLFEVCRVGDVLHVVPDRASILPTGTWARDDDDRASRLDAWLERYASGAPSLA